MKISKLIQELEKIKAKTGDCDVILHDSAVGDDMNAFDVYTDTCTDMPPLCVIGVDSDCDTVSVNRSIKVDTPLGPIIAKTRADEEYPGIWLLGGESDGNAVIEYDAYRNALVLRVWTKSDINGDPKAITVVSESPDAEQQLRKEYGSIYL